MNRFKRILYVSEPRSAQNACIARAVSLAQNNQAQLRIIEVHREVTAGIGMPPGGPISADLTATLTANRRQVLEDLVAPYREHIDVDIEVMIGRRFIEVIRAVLREGHDLVMKPAEDPSWFDRLFGSDDMHLLRECPCPLWLLKPDEKPNYSCILAAVDLDPYETDSEDERLSRQILELAASLALSDFAELHLVHVWDAPAAEFAAMWADNPEAFRDRFIEGDYTRHKAGIDHLKLELRKHVGDEAYSYLSPRVHMPKGRTEKEIPALANELKADLVVMGTVGRTGVPGLFIGNTAEAVLYQLQSAVLAIKPVGFVSPVTID